MQPIEETQEGKLVLSDRKMMVLQLVGSIREGKFERGLRTYPLIGDEVHLAHSEEINTIFAGQKTEFSINVGNFSQVENTPVWIDVNKLLSRHTAIVGNTGAGKSTTVATLIRRFLEKYEHAHIILFDIHGEYQNMNHPKIKHIKADNLKIPHWLLNFSQWQDLLSISPTATKQRDNLKTAIIELKEKHNPTFDKAKLSVDSPIYFPIEELLVKVKDEKKDTSLTEKLDTLTKDVRYDNLLKSGYNSTDELKNFAETILDRNFCCTILDLSKIYANYTSRKRVENIAKEGRKYGVGIVIVSQRPSEISETILAQCNNFIAHRLTTDKDKDFIKNLLPENLLGLTNLLPSISQGESLIAGDAVVLPARVNIEKLEDLPSIDCDFHTKWNKGPTDGFDVELVLDNWVNQKFSWKKEE